jgi:hypothetical protein
MVAPPPGATVTAAVPLWPSLIAVIVAGPEVKALINPVVLTVATSRALLIHVIDRPVRIAPLASRRVAISCCAPPIERFTVAGLTVTVATGAVLAAVVPLATLDAAPYTAFTFIVPRNAMSWN